MRDDRERLLDILEAIERIEQYAHLGREAFTQDELVQVWMVHHIEIIGEAIRGLSQTFRAQHPEVSWAVIVAMRNVLVHHYFGIDADEVWSAIERDVPELKRNVQAMLNEMGPA